MLVRDVLLRDGSALRLRAPEPADFEAIRDFYDRLSPESRYMRFHGFGRTDGPARASAEADGEDRVALIGAQGGRIVAAAGYDRLRVTTGAQNEAMRALARKFGAHLAFDHGEFAGTIDLTAPTITASVGDKRTKSLGEAVLAFNRAYWNSVIRMGDAMWAARDARQAKRAGAPVKPA